MRGFKLRKPTRSEAIILIVLAAICIVPFVLVWAMVIDQVRIARADRTDRPGIVFEREEIGLISIVDASHVALPDGRKFRLAHLIPPPAGSALNAKTEETIWRTFCAFNQKIGLRTVGTSSDGETLVEIWGFHWSPGGCGNSTWSERRAALVPHWQDMTYMMVADGVYRLEPEVKDKELLNWQSYARKEGVGVWNDPQLLQQTLDGPELEHRLTLSQNDKRIDDAEMLLRIDEHLYAPRILAMIHVGRDRDIFTAIRLAQLLETHGYLQGTEKLMELLADPPEQDFDSTHLQTIVDEYDTFWNVQPYTRQATDILKWYRQKIRPKSGKWVY